MAPIRSPYAAFILPIVALKKFFQLLHRLVLSALWSELIQGKAVDQSAAAAIFLILCSLSLIAYYGRAVSGLSFVVCCLLWQIDWQLTRRQFLNPKLEFTTLAGRDDWMMWQQASTDHLKFQASEMAQICLIRTQIRAGAFQEIVGTVWQVYLTLYNRSELLLHETPDTLAAFAKATQLSRDFAVPMTVVGSEGTSCYAAEPIGPIDREGSIQRAQTCDTIGCHKSPQRWHIFCQWRFSSTWRWLGESLSKFGFLLFAVIVANLMIPFGGLLHQAAVGLGTQAPVSFELNFLTLRWQMLVELAIAAGIMLIKGAQLSREEHIYITPATLTFCLGSQKIAQVPTSTVRDLLFLKQPVPTLLILGEQAIEIRGLQHDTEFRMMLWQLQAALNNFRPT